MAEIGRKASQTCARSRGRIVVQIGDYVRCLERSRHSPKTVDVYRRALLDFAEFIRGLGVRRIQDVSRDHIEKYQLHIVERSFRPASVELYLRAIRALFAHAASTHAIFLSPAEGLAVPRAPRRLLSVPSVDEIRRLLAQPDTSSPVGLRDRAMLETLYATGCRRQELTDLALTDMDLGNRTVRLMGKGRRERVVPMGAAAAGWIERYLSRARSRLLDGADSQWLWIARGGHRLSIESVPVVVLRHAERAGLTTRVSPHAIRRACATHMLCNGADPVQIGMLLGHSSLRHLSQYLRLGIREIREIHDRNRPGR